MVPPTFFRILQGGPGEILLFYIFLLFRDEKVKNEIRRYNLPAILLFLLFVIQNLAGVAFFSVDPDSRVILISTYVQDIKKTVYLHGKL